MNWSKVLQVLLAAAIAIGGAASMAAVAQAAGQIPGTPHKQACSVCHNAYASGFPELDFSGRNLRHVCVACHSDGGGANHMPFTEESMANPFGTTPDATPAGKGSWRSHNWDSPLVNAKAGARVPQNTYMTYWDTGTNFYKDPQTGQTLNTCARCHRIHDFEPTLSPDPGKDLVRLLRDKNDKDQMCNNCHYDWTNLTATQGSHPVKINYTSVWRTALSAEGTAKYQSYAQYTSSFYRTPRNHNPANPTSQLSNYYKDGLINCSTCHSVHFGDTDSVTFDNRSTANGSQTNPMSRSFTVLAGADKYKGDPGMLLRTDQYGTNASDINICTNCHKESQGSRTMTHHNPKTANQNVQCNFCHQSHVAHDNTSTPNKALITRTLTYSSSFVNAKGKSIQFTAASPYYKNTNDTGVCQACHRVPLSTEPIPGTNPVQYYPGDHDKATALAADCKDCHAHTQGFTAAGVCDSCHGYPPPAKAKQLLNYTTNETTTPHMVHAGGIAKPVADATKYGYQCIVCHYGGSSAPQHKNDNAQDVFAGTNPGTNRYGEAPVYNVANRTCSNVYCHSIGAPGDVNMTPGSAQFKTTPSWKNGLGTLSGKCDSCHAFTGSAGLATGSHARHIAQYSCQTCHMTTVNGTNAIISKTKHADGSKDLKFINNGTFVKSVGSLTCTNSCHTTPNVATWGVPSSAGCGTCHATSPSIGTLSPTTISTGAHRAHLDDASGPQFGIVLSSCQVCHTAYTTNGNHLNGVKDYNQAKCDACHPTANATVTWTNPATVTCRSCHFGVASVVKFTAFRNVSAVAPLVNSFDAKGHGQSFNSIGSVRGTTVAITCESCHDATKPHIATTDTSSRLKGTNQNTDVCAQCHNEDWSTSGTVRTKKVTKTHMAFSDLDSTNPTGLCSACHDSHGNGNARMIRSTIKFFPTSTAASIVFTNPSTGFVQMAPPYRGLCQICHTKTGHFKRGVAEPTNSSHYTYRNCLQCHPHEPGTGFNMAFAPSTGNCNSCHGYPPVKSMTGLGVHGNYSTALLDTFNGGYAGGGGSHAVPGHVGKDLSLSNSTNANCTNCHSMSTHMNNGTSTPVKANIHIVVDPKFKFNSTQPITYSGNSCSNVSCHYAPTPQW